MGIRVAIAGIGNCASALVQGVQYYKKAGGDVPGLMHTYFGKYHISDIEFVAAFDVDRRKIGKDLGEAIFEEPNCCMRFSEVPRLGVEVKPGPILDGVASHMRGSFNVYEGSFEVEVAEVLVDSGADMLVNFLPVGSHMATRFYAEESLKAGCAFVNCIPEFIASDPAWARRFEEKGLPIAGDDIKSQVGATIVHRALVDLLVSRGVKVERTYQLNIGGNTDFENMQYVERLKTKKESKTGAVESLIPYRAHVWAGPSGYIDFLGDNKICYIRIEGRKFGDTPVEIDLRLSVQDSPNSAGILIDVIRATKMALDREIAGPLISISAYAFKHPPVQVPDHIARTWVEEFISGKRER
jgi:myo-inositol-1-phosphate synthase